MALLTLDKLIIVLMLGVVLGVAMERWLASRRKNL